MGIFDKLFKKTKPVIAPSAPKLKPELKAPLPKTAKEIATDKGEPWVDVLSMDVDPENLHQGAFELDWNDKFVVNLIRAGYQMKPDDKDSDIVDRWFQAVCRNVVLETWEQEQAMNPNRIIRSKDIGDGRSEVS
jgi:hypothetical protein